MNGFYDLYIREGIADETDLGRFDGILDLQCRAVGVSHDLYEVFCLPQVGDRDRFDERREFLYQSCSIFRGYEVAALVPHAHDESQGIATGIDAALYICKAGCSAELDAHGEFSVVMAE